MRFKMLPMFALVVMASITHAISQDADPLPSPSVPLDQREIKQSEWFNAGFKSPETAMLTLWFAILEQDKNLYESCFHSSAGRPIGELSELKLSAEAANSLRFKSLRIIDARTVEIVFEVEGWAKMTDGRQALIKQILIQREGEWRILSPQKKRGVIWKASLH